MAALILATLLSAIPDAWASGGSERVDEFVSRSGTDRALDAYANGALGIVLPSYERVYRYLAWRAIVLGPAKLKARPLTDEAVQRSLGRYVDGWWLVHTPADTPIKRWQSASAAALGAPLEPIQSVMVESGYSGYINCPGAAFEFATRMLAELRSRADATPARLQEWTRAQNGVFRFCGRIEGTPGASRAAAAPVAPQVPQPLPTSEPAPWRQLREYQIAAAHFYGGDFDRSGELFRRIAQTPSHPMKPWGAYLALRSKVRAQSVSVPAEPQHASAPEAFVRDVEAEAQAILQDPALAPVHEATRATLRAVLARAMPLQRLQALSAELANPDQDPTTDDRLGDWRLLANGAFDAVGAGSPTGPAAELMARLEFIDWMMSAGPCDGRPCELQRAHARERWQHAEPGSASRRAWLVATLMLSERLDDALEREARAVAAAAPEAPTVRYNLARLLRAAGRRDEARALVDESLRALQAQPQHSISAENLLRGERFALSTDLRDAASYLVRTTFGVLDRDTHERSALATFEPRLDDDGLKWLDTRLPVIDLLSLAHEARLPADLRLGLAVAAWLRADAADKAELAQRAARLVEDMSPALREPARAYRAASTPAMRRHVLVLAALRFGLSANVGPSGVSPQRLADSAGNGPARDPDATASMWCKLGADAADAADASAAVLAVTSDPALRDAELARLRSLKTATGFVGDHVMRWATAHPQDPDVPWLLHVVVMSTRGGCLDAGSGRLSRAAHALLHKRYPDSEWTAKTPYYY